MTDDKVEALAKGRVYTGRQAKTLGLVDDLGGMDTAIAQAKQAAGLTGKTVAIEQVPQEPSIVELLRSFLFPQDEDSDDSARIHGTRLLLQKLQLAAALRPYLGLLMHPGENAIRMQPMPTVE